MGAKDYAVVVGINHYPDYRPLVGACEDAREVRDWLVDPKGGDVPLTNCRLVLSQPDPPAQPLQDQVDAAFGAIAKEIEDTGGRRLYFYFSGHGLGADVDDVALCMARWSDLFRKASLSHREYKNELRRSGLFTQIVFWLDCCRNRNFNISGNSPTFGWPGPEKAVVREFVAFATEFQDAAFEAGRGIFTRALLNGLRGAAERSGATIVPSSLKRHLELETPRLAKAAGRTQAAEVVNSFSDDDEHSFGGTITQPNVTIEIDPRHTAEVVLESPTLEVLRRWPPTPPTLSLALGRGAYTLRDVATNEERTFRVRFDGEEGANVVRF
jgi:uncharacterized caspase-like protein